MDGGRDEPVSDVRYQPEGQTPEVRWRALDHDLPPVVEPGARCASRQVDNAGVDAVFLLFHDQHITQQVQRLSIRGGVRERIFPSYETSIERVVADKRRRFRIHICMTSAVEGESRVKAEQEAFDLSPPQSIRIKTGIVVVVDPAVWGIGAVARASAAPIPHTAGSTTTTMPVFMR